MPIRLTESRLRQIIREEMRSLSGRRSLREGTGSEKFYIGTPEPYAAAEALLDKNPSQFQKVILSTPVGKMYGNGLYACKDMISAGYDSNGDVVEVVVNTTGFVDVGDAKAARLAMSEPPPGARGISFVSADGPCVVVFDRSAIHSATPKPSRFTRRNRY